MNQMLPIVKTFTEYLLDERHFSQYTSRCYGADLRQYVEYLEETSENPQTKRPKRWPSIKAILAAIP